MYCKMIHCRREATKDGYCKEHWRQWNQGTLRPGRINPNPPLCKVEDCDGVHYAKGYCATHYAQYKKGILGQVTHTYTPRKL